MMDHRWDRWTFFGGYVRNAGPCGEIPFRKWEGWHIVTKPDIDVPESKAWVDLNFTVPHLLVTEQVMN